MPGGRERLGVTVDRPFVAVALDGAALGDVDPDDLAVPGCVVAGVATGGPPAALPASPPDLDLLLTDRPDPPAPWVGCADLPAVVGRLEAACRRSPLAATALVELLRFSPRLSVPQALVAESLTYAMLQAGPEHRRWLAGRRRRTRRAPTRPAVRIERRGDELWVMLDRPEVHNAFGAAMRDGLVEALQLAVLDPTLRTVHLTGAGPSFCSGGDLDEFGSVPDPATAHAVRMAAGAAPWLHRCADRVRAEVHGACIGAGLELAALAGAVVAAPDAAFSLPEVGMGLVPGAGGTASLPRRAARQRVAYLALTGEAVGARTAADWGLVDEIVEG